MDLSPFGFTPIAYLALAVVVFGIMYYARHQHKSHLPASDEFAKRIGLTLEPGNLFAHPRVTGSYRRRAITLDTFSRRSAGSKRRRTYTRIVQPVNNPANIYFALSMEDVFSKVGRLVGTADVPIGDEEIDRRLTVQSRPETFAARLLVANNLRQRLLQARSVNPQLDGSQLFFAQRGAECSPAGASPAIAT